MKEAYELMQTESNSRARETGFSTIKYWLENDVDVGVEEMPIAHYRP